jgi:hypothetical protein
MFIYLKFKLFLDDIFYTSHGYSNNQNIICIHCKCMYFTFLTS